MMSKQHTHPTKFHSLSRRIVWQFCLFTLTLSTIYGLLAFILLYTLEDSFIEKEIQGEAAYLRQQYQATGHWVSARRNHMQMHFSKATFPDDMRSQSQENPAHGEFYGQDGRHYHLYTFHDYADTYLLAEVSDELMVRQIRSGIIQLLIVGGLLVTFIACLLAGWIGRKTARPIKQLAELVDGVAPEQIPDQFATHFPNNEIGILARTLEQTLLRISQALEREKFFTRDVSHELRTPLAVIKNAVELHQSYDTSSAQEKVVIERISAAAEQMDKTVHTLLMLAREETSHAQKSPVQLMPIVEQSILDNRLLLDGKTVEVIVENNCQTQVYAQAGMLKVLLDNLLSNAFQYTDSGEVRVAFDSGILRVEDTGPGIDHSISNHITDVGVKGHQSTGFGFGLSIVKRLCEQQTWQLIVESDPGTTIKVTLT